MAVKAVVILDRGTMVSVALEAAQFLQSEALWTKILH
jgi:transketolase C-terminal domain/subunit